MDEQYELEGQRVLQTGAGKVCGTFFVCSLILRLINKNRDDKLESVLG
jgi:hypothetical protein